MNGIPDKRFLAHFPQKVSQAIDDYATNVAFKWSRYLFVRREGKKQFGYCTHCGQELETMGRPLIHNSKTICYGCGSECTVKTTGRRRSKMVDEAYFIWYEKSMVNPKAIVAIGLWAIRDYRENFCQVENKFVPVAAYLFEPDNVQMFKRNFGFPCYFGRYNYSETWVGGWQECKSAYTLFTWSPMSGKMAHLEQFCAWNSVAEAVKGTSFSWSGWEHYKREDGTKFFGFFVQHPCIEYFTKLGFKDLVIGKLEGHGTQRAVNWQGKDLFQILKINKQELKEIKSQGARVTYDFLAAFKQVKKADANFTITEAVELADTFGTYYFEEIRKIEHGDIKKNAIYLLKQYRKHPKNFQSAHSVWTTWRDYIQDCIKLHKDLKKESVLFPNNLHEAHQQTIRLIKMKADKTLNKKIALRLKSLDKYRFEFGGLFIRPASSSMELFDEGKALSHCVYNNYAERYAKGETDLFFIRKTDEPEKPFYTMEVKDGRVIQVRGLRNCEPTSAVFELVEVFKAQKLKSKSKTKLAVPA